MPAGCVHQYPLQVDASRNCGATYPHTAHQPGSARIVYRFHPFFDRDVSVERTSNRSATASVLVRIFPADELDDVELGIVVPCWMLDEAACTRVVLREKPLISIHAILQLRTLVDQFAPKRQKHHSESHSSHASGDQDAETTDFKATRCQSSTQATDA